MMTNRERVLAIMSGRAPDRIPWIPRLLLWYNAHQRAGILPDRYQGYSLRDIERDLGLGTPARDGSVFRTELRGVEVRTHQLNEMELLTQYITPQGTVTTLFRGSELLRKQGIEDMQVEFMLKSREDYAAVEYILEHTEYVATYAEYNAYEREIGDDGYPMVSTGDCPLHKWLRSLAGYNDGYYHLADHPDEVERLLATMEQLDREKVWPLIADSPARLILHGEHLSSQMTPPNLFERFITPYYQEFSALLHSRGKTLTMHADNDTRAILSHLEQAGFDMVECFVTDPMVSTTLAEARAAWGDRLIIWGGVPAVILEESYSDEEFESFMENVRGTIAPGDAFILGVADNVMPTSKIERIRRITEIVEEWGPYPLSV